MKKEDNSFGITSVTIGIVGLVLLLSNSVASIILGIVGLVFAKKQNKIQSNEWARKGKILNIISIILGIIFTIVTIIVLVKNQALLANLASQIQQ